MVKLIKRKQTSITEKFKQGQKELNDKLSLNKEHENEELIKKVLTSNIAPIVHIYYIDLPPVVSSKQIPYYSRKGFKKSILMIRKAIRGTLFNDTEFVQYHDRKFTVEEIYESIRKHKLALTPEYKPVDKKFLRVPLEQFLFNPYAKSIGKSFLLYWMGVDPIPMVKPVEDKYPEITKQIIKLFEFEDLTLEDRNYLIEGVAKFKEILSETKISPIFRFTPIIEAEILWAILTDLFYTINKEVVPKNFVSPRFTGWVKEGLIKSDYTLTVS